LSGFAKEGRLAYYVNDQHTLEYVRQLDREEDSCTLKVVGWDGRAESISMTEAPNSEIVGDVERLFAEALT